MPTPAGTGLSRRTFIARSSGLALAVFGGSALAPRAFEEGIADAMAAGRPNSVLVSVFLDGGLDTLGLLAPVDDTTYQALRPTLKMAPNAAMAFRDDTRLQWHSAAAPLKALHEADKLCVIPAIGYASPNQSHFTSRHFYEVGDLNEAGQIGWLGRWLDRNGRMDNPLQGLSLDTTLAPALAAANVPVASVASPTNFALGSDGVGATIKTAMNQAYGALGRLPTTDPSLLQARGAAAQVVGIQERLADLYGKQITDVPVGVTYPGNSGFANNLRALAKMLAMGLPIRCVALDGNGGYDTHENQATTLTNNLTQFSNALAAFQADLEGRGLADRVLLQVWSEFGRRPAENGSGTDHGAAGARAADGLDEHDRQGHAGRVHRRGHARQPPEPAQQHGLPRRVQDGARGLARRRPDRRAPERLEVLQPRAHQGLRSLMRRAVAVLAVLLAAAVAVPAAAEAARGGKARCGKRAACKGTLAARRARRAAGELEAAPPRPGQARARHAAPTGRRRTAGRRRPAAATPRARLRRRPPRPTTRAT